MKQRPIIMSAESVQAILDGRKTQTRRVVKENKNFKYARMLGEISPNKGEFTDRDIIYVKQALSKYGQKGDRLWVKESYTFANFGKITIYKSDKKDQFGNDWQDTASQTNSWKSPLFMPRSLSRLTLEITNIRVERLQDITEDDAIAEGCVNSNWLYWQDTEGEKESATSHYAELWDKLNAKRSYSWDSNPFVWVIEFRRVEE